MGLIGAMRSAERDGGDPLYPLYSSGSWIPRTAGAERAVGEWNHMRVRCEGARITVWLNGELANEGWEASEARGAIALQSEGAPIHFRRVELTPL